MARTFIELPPNLLRETAVDWNIVGAIAAPGQTDAGALPVSRLDGGGYWTAKLNDIQFWEDDQVRAFRASRILTDNGSASIVVPRHEVLQPWPLSGGVAVTSYGAIPHSDGSLLNDGSGYAQDVIDIVCVGGAALRATSMNIRINRGSALRGGEPFSIEHATLGHHMYEVGACFDNGDGTYKLVFRTPLREAIVDGDRLHFDQPKCVMRLSAQDAMAFKLATFPYLPHSVTFIESNLSSGS